MLRYRRYRHAEAIRGRLAEGYAPATARCDRRGERALREAASRLRVPHLGD